MNILRWYVRDYGRRLKYFLVSLAQVIYILMVPSLLELAAHRRFIDLRPVPQVL